MQKIRKRAVVWSVLLTMCFNTTVWGMELQSDESSESAILIRENKNEETETLDLADDIELEQENVPVDETEILEEPTETLSEDSEQQASGAGSTSADAKEDAEDKGQELADEAGDVISDEIISNEAQMSSAASDFVIEGTVLKEYTGAGGQVVIPGTVTEIGSYAFRNCTGLQSITIPSSVTIIGYEAFLGCTGLRTVTLNSG